MWNLGGRRAARAMLRGRRAPASVYLCLVCLLVQAARPAARLCIRTLLYRVQDLISTAPNQDLGSRLYTPSRNDCASRLGFALKCFGEEIKVLLDEWKTAGFNTGLSGSTFQSHIEVLAVKLNLTEAEGLKCERLNEETAEKFLVELKDTFEKINSDYSSRC